MPRTDPSHPFTVMVADNFHYMDDRETYKLGSYESLTAAVAASKQIIDQFLESAFRPGMSTDALYSQYTSFGDEPYIVYASEPEVPFCAWTYAKARCAELCAAATSTGAP